MWRFGYSDLWPKHAWHISWRFVYAWGTGERGELISTYGACQYAVREQWIKHGICLVFECFVALKDLRLTSCLGWYHQGWNNLSRRPNYYYNRKSFTFEKRSWIVINDLYHQCVTYQGRTTISSYSNTSVLC